MLVVDSEKLLTVFHVEFGAQMGYVTFFHKAPRAWMVAQIFDASEKHPDKL